MSNELSFTAHQTEGRFTRDWDGEDLVDQLLEEVHFGTQTESGALKKALPAARKAPENLELQNFVAGRFWNIGMRSEAFDTWSAAHDLAMSKIPPTFKGTIDYNVTDNRPFLRVCHGMVLAYLDQGNGKKALTLCNKLLAWSPSDNLGVRFLRPNAYELAGKAAKALSEFEKLAPDWPVFYYKVSHVHFAAQRYESACTALRKGILKNPYVAEAILGNPAPVDHLYWVGSNLQSAETAIELMDSDPTLRDPKFRDFVDWVFNCASVLSERAQYMALHEDLTFLRPGPERSASVEALQRLWTSFDPATSDQIVAKRINRWSEEYFPWDRASFSNPRPQSHSA